MTGNKLVDNILMGICSLMAVATAGLYAYTEHFYEKPLPKNASELARLKIEAKRRTIVKPYKMDKMVVNLKSRGNRLRFLDVIMYMVPFEQEDRDTLDKNKALLYDTIIDIAGDMEPAELNTISGKLLLENRIKKKLVETFDKNIIKEIYFSKFVIQ